MIKRWSFHLSALAAFALALPGCAGDPMVKDATILSTSKNPKALASAPKVAKDLNAKEVPEADAALPALDLEGALRQAQALRKSGDFSAATRVLSQLVLAAPDDSRVMGEYGKTLVAMGRTDDALAFLERAIELQPLDWSLFSAQGVAFDQKGQYLQAQRAYDRALALKPGEPTVLSNNALSHMQSGDLDGAERLLLQARDAGGDYPRIASNLALVQSLKAGRPMASTEQIKAGIRAAGPNREPDPNDPETIKAAILAAGPDETGAPSSEADDVAAVQGRILAAGPDETADPNDAEAVKAAILAAGPEMSGRETTLQTLADDPTVRMQAVPQDKLAGTKVVPAKRPVAVKPKPTETALLRPALSDSHTPAPASEDTSEP